MNTQRAVKQEDSIAKYFVTGRQSAGDRKEETIITRLTLGHRDLNYTLHKTSKHPTGVPAHCNQLQSVQRL